MSGGARTSDIREPATAAGDGRSGRCCCIQASSGLVMAPSRCAAHHARHWADGVDTDLDNLVLLCHQHHHDHHDHGLTLTHRDGRTLTHRGWGPAPP